MTFPNVHIEYDTGFLQGQAQGFREALSIANPGRHAVPPRPQPLRGWEHPEINKQEAKDMQHAMHKSWQTS